MGGEERFSFLSLDPPPLLFFGSLSILHAAKTQIVPWSFFPRGTGGVLLGILVGGVLPGSPNPDPTQTEKCNFHTRFQTWPLGRNYVIIT